MNIQRWVNLSEEGELTPKILINIYDPTQSHCFSLTLAIDKHSEKVTKITYNTLDKHSKGHLIKDLYSESVIGKSITEINQLIEIYNIIYED